MQLNIYSISHPIIQLLSNTITVKNKNNILYYYNYKNLGLLLMYEILRKYIKIQNVYIKSLYSTKELKLINYNEKYLILSDISNNYEMISGIKTLIPNIDIININYINIKNEQKTIQDIEKVNANTQIFILEEQLKNVNVISIIKYLTLMHQIPINHINIACIKSEQKILKQIGSIYPKVKVYTTQILYTR
uniref:Uracil phosphoribosyltransferase n=1 Tax=Laurencia catarinensis TaxID=197326 RepID=UPI0028D69835|nr:Uracil phosphoribosyltransferase [Laurencia catarinensis]WMP12576.1 Uracil phosphoribosyltransferase [Laurencia catarinensis]